MTVLTMLREFRQLWGYAN